MIVLRRFLAVLCSLLPLGTATLTFAAEPLATMLNLPGTGEDPTGINFATLPVLRGEHAIVSRGDKTWQFRLHNYLAFHDGRYWCMWSHGPIVEDNPTQHVRYSTSTDGLRWIEPRQIVGPSPRQGFRYISRGLWVRDGQLIALAGHDEAFDAKGRVHFFGPSLQLMGFAWDGDTGEWKPLGIVFDKAINNFPPARMPNGEWGMICRGPDYRRDVFMLTGGVASPSAWTKSPIVTETPANGFRPEEPDWWTSPRRPPARALPR